MYTLAELINNNPKHEDYSENFVNDIITFGQDVAMKNFKNIHPVWYGYGYSYYFTIDNPVGDDIEYSKNLLSKFRHREYIEKKLRQNMKFVEI